MLLLIITVVCSLQVNAGEVKEVKHLQIKVIDLIENHCKYYSMYLNPRVCIKEMKECVNVRFHEKMHLTHSQKVLEAYSECYSVQQFEK